MNLGVGKGSGTRKEGGRRGEKGRIGKENGVGAEVWGRRKGGYRMGEWGGSY